jgi:hypothetical protein
VTLAFLVSLAVALSPGLTPGALCAPGDPDFRRFAYAGHVALCHRHLTSRVKIAVARAYGVPRRLWPSVEFDHFIPLCAGGSNAATNVWPEPLAAAKRKDQLEDRLCGELRAGTITQAQAVAQLRAWQQEEAR